MDSYKNYLDPKTWVKSTTDNNYRFTVKNLSDKQIDMILSSDYIFSGEDHYWINRTTGEWKITPVVLEELSGP